MMVIRNGTRFSVFPYGKKIFFPYQFSIGEKILLATSKINARND